MRRLYRLRGAGVAAMRVRRLVQALVAGTLLVVAMSPPVEAQRGLGKGRGRQPAPAPTEQPTPKDQPASKNQAHAQGRAGSGRIPVRGLPRPGGGESRRGSPGARLLREDGAGSGEAGQRASRGPRAGGRRHRRPAPRPLSEGDTVRHPGPRSLQEREGAGPIRSHGVGVGACPARLRPIARWAIRRGRARCSRRGFSSRARD